jgi:hypothetical protein
MCNCFEQFQRFDRRHISVVIVVAVVSSPDCLVTEATSWSVVQETQELIQSVALLVKECRKEQINKLIEKLKVRYPFISSVVWQLLHILCPLFF